MSGLEGREGAGVAARVLLTLWAQQVERSVSQQHLLLVQLHSALQGAAGPARAAVIREEDAGVVASAEAPGEREVLERLWSRTGDQQTSARLTKQVI